MAHDESILRLVINTILHVAILFTILGAFFILYVSHIEERSYQKEITSLINEALLPQLQSLTGTSKETVQTLLRSLPLQSIQQSYATTAKWVSINNEWLIRVIWCIVTFLFVLLAGLLILYYVRCRGRLNFWEVLFENIIIFIFVGTIEIYFFINIAANYVPVHPSLMTDVFITTLQQQVG